MPLFLFVEIVMRVCYNSGVMYSISMEDDHAPSL